MTWFKTLTGFAEKNPTQVRANLSLEGESIISSVNGKRFTCGTLEVPTLQSLRDAAPSLKEFDAKISIKEVVGNVQHFHVWEGNAGAMFQAASQFNLLEMVGPDITPEEGIGIYQYDHTQGPACAIACGAGTIYRNYFAEVNGQIGQTADNQIDCLDEIGAMLGNADERLWQMRNGYALPGKEGLKQVTEHIQSLSQNDYRALQGCLKIGLQLNTEVTLSEAKHLVSQAYCSALPVAYSSLSDHLWEAFARIVLEASYEATFYAALQNYRSTGNPSLYLTLVGGGAFGNKAEWIFDAIERALQIFRATPLEVSMVSYGRSDKRTHDFVERVG
ncbi:MAG: hypothetical protein AB8F95_12760 [Bacteroidia bacterium]